MNADLITQITKMVLEKLEENPTSKTLLTDFEIKRWNQITGSMQQSPRQNIKANAINVPKPLSPEELRSWNSISYGMRNKPTGNSEQIKLYSNS